MRIYKTKNYDEMSRKAANIISAQIILKPESVLGLATDRHLQAADRVVQQGRS